MITKTIGVGGDYADLNLAVNHLIALGSCSDNYTFNFISDIVNSTSPNLSNIKPNQKTIDFNLNGFTIVSSVAIYIAMEDISDYDGLIKFRNGNVFFNSNLSTCLSFRCIGRVTFGSAGPDRFHINNLYVSNHIVTGGSTGRLVDCYNSKGGNTGYYSAYATYKIYNVKTYYKGSGSNWNFGSDSIGGAGAGTGPIYLFIENSSFYNLDQTKIALRLQDYSWSDYPSIKNTICYGKWYGTKRSEGSGYPKTEIINCAASDNSLDSPDTDYTTIINLIKGITALDFISIDPTSSDFLKINKLSALYGKGTTTTSSWNTQSIEGNPRPNAIGKVSIGASEPIVIIPDLVTFTKGSTSISIKKPYYQYSTTLKMGLHYSRLNGSYKIRDDGSQYDSRRCNIDTWLLSATDQKSLYDFLNGVGRGENFTMTLIDGSGFFPFGPDKGDSGDFVCTIVNYEPGNANLNPYLQHSNKLSLQLVTAPSYTPPSPENEGDLQIGTVSTLRPVQSFPDVTYDFSISREVSRGGVVSSVDIGTSCDVIETTLPLELRPGNAAALITYLQATRKADITINAPINTWLFGVGCDSVGLDSGLGGEYVCKLLSNEITITHDNFNLFKMSIKLWKKSYTPRVIYDDIELYYSDGETSVPDGELVTS